MKNSTQLIAEFKFKNKAWSEMEIISSVALFPFASLQVLNILSSPINYSYLHPKDSTIVNLLLSRYFLGLGFNDIHRATIDRLTKEYIYLLLTFSNQHLN